MEDKYKLFKRLICYSFIILTCVIVPLYVENAYFNITKAKFNAYRFGIVILLLALIFIMAFDKQKIKFEPNKLEKLLISFGLLSLLSSLLAYHFDQAFFGSNGWYIGTFTIMTAIVFCIFISRTKFNYKFFWGVILGINIIIFIFSILHSAKIDVFNLHLGINKKQYFSYISTVGNVNWMVGYLCLIIPMLFCRYLKLEDKRQYLYLFVLFLGVFNIILVNSDGIFLGFGIMAFFLVPYIFKNVRYLNKSAYIIVLLVFVGLILKLPIFDAKYLEISGLTKIIISNIALIGLSLIALVIIYLCHKNLINDKALKITRNIILIILGLFVIYFIYDMVKAFVTYNYYWGNNRALIWNESFKIYKDYFSLKQKIFGVGPEYLNEWYYYLSENLKARVLVSHSEPIQLLLTGGIVGIINYVLIVVMVIKSYFKNNLEDNYQLPFLMSIIAYLGQSLVNSMTPLNVGLLALVFAMYMKNEKEVLK